MESAHLYGLLRLGRPTYMAAKGSVGSPGHLPGFCSLIPSKS